MPWPSPIAPADRADLIKRIKAGKESYAALGREFGIHRVSVGEIAKRLGLPPRRAGRRLKEPQNNARNESM